MPFVPFPFFVSALIILIFFNVLKHIRESGDEPNFAFLILILMSALQSVLLGLRWGYNLEAVHYISPIVAAIVPPLVYVGVSEFVRGRRKLGPAWIFIHLVPAIIVLIMLVFWPLGIDLTLVGIFLGYAVATLRLTWGGEDVLGFTSLEDIVPVYRAIILAAGALLFSAGVDTAVYLAFLWDRSGYVTTLLSFGNLIMLLILGGAAASASRGNVTEARAEVEAETKDEVDGAAGETIDLVNTMMRDRKLYRDANLNLNRLARKSLIPARQISQAVNTVVGQNVSQYVNSFRIAEACDLLENTEKSITEIMFDVGFQTKSNFNREFRRITDMTPKDWRVARSRK